MSFPNIQIQDSNLIMISSEDPFVRAKKGSSEICQLCMDTNLIAVQKFSPESNFFAFGNRDDQLVVENLNDIIINPLNQVQDIACEIVEFVRTSTTCIEIPKPCHFFKDALNLSRQSREFIEVREDPNNFLDYGDSSFAPSSVQSENLRQKIEESLETRGNPKKKLDSRDSSSETSSIDPDQEEGVYFLEPTELFFFEEAQNS